jgi:hypothetical protein
MDMQQDPERNEGPFLAAALLCETLLREEDGTLSLVRVIDQVTIAGTSLRSDRSSVRSSSTVSSPLDASASASSME